VTPAEASRLRDEDPVLGFEAAGRIWAIPWFVMKNHHLANLTLEGQPFLVTLCEVCVAGGVFDPVLDGRRGRFQLNGWYRGSPLMTDDLTGSVWAVINGRCLAGPSEGAALPMRPIVHAPWRDWASMYPDGLVVHGEDEPRDGHGADCWGPGHERDDGHPVRGIDGGELVVGVDLGQTRRAYHLAAIHRAGGIVEDSLDGRPIVVVAVPGTWLCAVFVPALNGTPVDLVWDRAEDPPTHLVDDARGWRFDLFGRCVTGEHRGVQLPYVRSSLKKWRRWLMTYPDADLRAPGHAPPAIS
jgi:hypothetical protein